MIVGRLLAGIGIGITSAIVPLYISEVLVMFIHSHSQLLAFDMLTIPPTNTIYLCADLSN